jgi:carotenoid 1,2-hydratase
VSLALTGSRGPRFDIAVAPGGYAWWYLDALSDDGHHGLTVIAFIGSVFSPYYAWARGRSAGGFAEALNHCVFNVALYGTGRSGHGKRWAMTERGARHVERSASHLRIGPSAVEWDGDTLTLHIDEVTAPWPARIRGTLRLHPAALMGQVHALDGAGAHRWQPIAPCARVEVDLAQPAWRWSGPGYFDSNHGERALERDFVRWDWSRATLADGRTLALYDVTRRQGAPLSLALAFDTDGSVQAFEAPPRASLPPGGWRVDRATRSDAGSVAKVEQTLEDAPFYARSVVSASLLGQPVKAVHESLSLERFSAPWVRMLLPFRMPRRG